MTPYEQDFAQWTRETAEALRAGRLDELDIEHVAEEIEDLGISERRQRQRRLRGLVTHLLKWKYQPEMRCRSWRSTMATQRAELEDVFEDSPSLRARLAESVAEAYPKAVELASIETGLPRETFPAECPFSPEQILDRRFLPE